jgi:hypothetical protein
MSGSKLTSRSSARSSTETLKQKNSFKFKNNADNKYENEDDFIDDAINPIKNDDETETKKMSNEERDV